MKVSTTTRLALCSTVLVGALATVALRLDRVTECPPAEKTGDTLDRDDLIMSLRQMNRRVAWNPILSHLKGAVAAVRARDSSVSVLTEDHAVRECLAADIVLASDFHDDDVHRTAFRRVVSLVAPKCRGPVGIVIEPIPYSRQSEIDEALRSRRPELILQLLQNEWPFPVVAYRDMLEDFFGRGWDIIAASAPLSTPFRTPGPEVPDGSRRPIPPTGAGSDGVVAESLADTNARVVRIIDGWIQARSSQEGPPPLVFVLYGASHQFGATGLRSRLTALGYRTAVLLPILNELELAVQERLEPDDWRDWIGIGAGVFRPGVLRPSEWIARGEDERRRFDAIFDRLPSRVTGALGPGVARMLEELHRTNRVRALPILKRFVREKALRKYRGLLGYYIRLSEPDWH